MDDGEHAEMEDTPEFNDRPGLLRELPLFPLDLVLFPYMILPLHIFEERYKEMINRCIRESIPFGIVLATGVDEESGSVTTSLIGCTARILRVERLPDGRMNIEIVGEERFRILDTHEQCSYRTAVTEPYQDDVAENQEPQALADEVNRLLRDYLTRLLAQRGHAGAEFELPDDPHHLSFIVGCALPTPNEQKQFLLSRQSVEERLMYEREALLLEVTKLRRAAETREEPELEWKRLEPNAYDDYLSSN